MPVEVGAAAPEFALADQHGQMVRLADFRGRVPVVLVFYPWAFTGVCTGELTTIRDELLPRWRDQVAVLAASVDSRYTQRVFAERERLDFPLVSDFWPHGAVARAYGVFDAEKGCALRGTFVIDTGGVVRWRTVNAVPHARDVADYHQALTAL